MAVKLAKIIRESLKDENGKPLKPWKMHQLMGKKTVQAYLSFERAAKRVSIDDLIKLQEVSGRSVLEFWELMRKYRN